MPAGKRTDRTSRVHRLETFQFDGAECRVCPLRSRCIAANVRKGRRVLIHPQEPLLQEARALQQSTAYDEYRALRFVSAFHNALGPSRKTCVFHAEDWHTEACCLIHPATPSQDTWCCQPHSSHLTTYQSPSMDLSAKFVLKVKLAVLWEVGQPLDFCEVDLDELKAGEVLVKVGTSGVCRSGRSAGFTLILPHFCCD